ncbi:MAG: ABC transporter permease [Syntrophomonas sp.]|uniref:ABC transporter permease n=1 Tax=Syntrophomonas sp. TaxID=2053627 RepID=UPI0026159C4C|nr:ABC transporter permease [Syntrophomonas sp.]MDD3878880.1 ABC transporter permease [Syntrophomonas sp.]MDD4626846.1 ABC transporter permease [Syntrophomonas sp.]
MKSLVLNPILAKEFRSRMRNWKSPLMISLYLGLLGLITLAYYWMQQKRGFYSGFGPDVGPQIFIILSVFQLLLLSFVTPALTAGVINGERERQTFDLLLCTRLSSASIVLNKLLASISYILLLVIASLPVFAIVYFFGGVLLSDMGRVILVSMATAITFGVIGIFCSTLFKRTQVSMVVSYVVVLLFLVGTMAVTVFLQGIQTGPYPRVTAMYFSYANPLVALFSIFPNQAAGVGIMSSFLGGYRTYGYNAAVSQALSPWQYNFIFDGVLIIVLLLLTVFLLDPVGRFKRLRKNPAVVETEAESAPAEG